MTGDQHLSHGYRWKPHPDEDDSWLIFRAAQKTPVAVVHLYDGLWVASKLKPDGVSVPTDGYTDITDCINEMEAL